MKKKWVYTVPALAVLLNIGSSGIWMTYSDNEAVYAADIEEETLNDYHFVSFDGKKYEYNSRITTILYAGIDTEEELTTYNRYSIAPRSDCINLILLDDYHKEVKILAISRDTITEVTRYSMNGNYRDSYKTQIGYAYSYGDGGKISCQNLRDSVSLLLGGIPVHEYIITDDSSIVKANEMIGGVELYVPNDDLAAEYPELTKGAKVTLDASNADAFVRYRDVDIPFSNNGRMERQEEFIKSFMKKFIEKASADPEGVWNQIEELSSDTYTSITRSQYLNLLGRLEEETFCEDDYYYLEGKDVHGEYHDELHPDEGELLETVLELFYLKEGEE